MSYLSRRHVSTFTGSSSGPQRKRIQDYIDFLQKHILWVFGIPQCVFVKNLCSLGSVFFEGLRMTQWRSKHVALMIYYFKVYQTNCCVIDWHICVFYTYIFYLIKNHIIRMKKNIYIKSIYIYIYPQDVTCVRQEHAALFV